MAAFFYFFLQINWFFDFFIIYLQKNQFSTMENIVVKGEPKKVTDIRNKILKEFDDLVFIEDGHKYFLNGVQLPSVSEVTHRFCQYPFNTDEQAERYAEKHGETPEYWKDQWNFTSLRATVAGSLIHEYGEGLGWLRNGHPELMPASCAPKYVKDKNWLIPTRPKEEAILKFYDELNPNLHFVLAETKVYTGKNLDKTNINQNYCGTFDLLFYYENPKNDDESGLVIFDFKTNKELTKAFSRENGKFLLPPFENYYEESLSYYTIQLNCYQLPLEDIGLKVIARRIIWLKDDGNYELIPISDVTDSLREVL